MTDIDDVLEQCLTDLLTGASTLEECLARYPEHVEQLEPLLWTAARLHMGHTVRPAPAFKSYARSRLVSHMQSYPRRTAPKFSPFWRLMAGLVSVMLTLFVTGTVYAQGALPGDAVFYPWKLTSEHAWRIVSPDTITTDLHIANRRIQEMSVTSNDRTKWIKALDGYTEVHTRLQVEMDHKTLDQILPPVENISFPSAATVTAEPVSEPPQSAATAISPFTATEEMGNGNGNGKDKGQKDDDQKGNGKDKKDQRNQLSTPTVEPTVIPPTPIPETLTPEPTVEAPEIVLPSPTPETVLPTSTASATATVEADSKRHGKKTTPNQQ